MKRQRGRNRGGGGGKPQHNANRAFESNGPEGVKVRGAAQGVFEKYQQLARDAASAGDRVLAENYLQHAEHYFRTLRAMQPQKPASEILGRDYQASGFDIDFEAEPDENAEPYTENAENDGEGNQGERQQQGDRQYRDDRPRFENRDRQQQQGDRPREDRQYRDDRPRDGQQQRDERPRENQARDDRPRDDRPRENQPRDDRPRDGQPRDDRPQGQQGENRNRRDRWRERDGRERFERPRDDQPRDPLAVVEPQAAPLPAAEPAPSSPVLRSASGDVSHAPAFLGRSAEPKPEASAEEAPKPRRGRKPKAETATEEA